MAVSLVSFGAFNYGQNALSATELPAGYQDNDLLILVVNTANQAVSTPSGWTRLANSPQGTGTAGSAGAVAVDVFYLWASGTVSVPTIADSGSYQTAQIFCFRGVDMTSPFNVTAGGVKASASTSVSCPSVTTTVDNCMVVNVVGLDKDLADADTLQSGANANLTSFSEVTDNTQTSGVGGGIAVFKGIKASAGSTGNTTATSDTSTTLAYHTFALTPMKMATVALGTIGTATTGIATAGKKGAERALGTIGTASTGISVAGVKNTPPTVALGTPTDGANITDTTPDLTFTGTDPQGDSVDYEVQVSTDVGFSAGGETLNLSNTGAGGSFAFSSDAVGWGNSFEVATGGALVKTIARMKYFNTALTGNIRCKLYLATGTAPSEEPTGSALATSDPVDLSTVTTSGANYEFTFDGSYTLQTGVRYAILFIVDSGSNIDSTHQLNNYYDTANSVDGNLFTTTNGGSTFTKFTPYDNYFYLYTQTDGIIIDALSTDHTGFSAGASHPTASGVQQTYTVQTALDAGTYYWRVRAKDPTGSNLWGEWSSVNDFTLSSNDKSGSFTMSNTGAMASAGQKGAKKALDAITASGNFAVVGRKDASRALGTIGTATTGISFTAKKNALRALGTIGTASTGIASAGKKGALRALGTIGTATANMTTAGRKGAKGIMTIANSAVFTVAGRKGALAVLNAITASTGISVTGAKQTNEDKTGSFTITGNASFTVAGKKGAIVPFTIAGAGAFTVNAKKGAQRALGTIGSATTNINANGKKGAQRALGTIGTATTGINTAGKKGAKRALGTIGSAVAELNVLLSKNAKVPMGDITAVGTLNVAITTARFSANLVFDAVTGFLVEGNMVENGRFQVWNGSAWVVCPAKVWNGSAWETKQVKVWNGSQWT